MAAAAGAGGLGTFTLGDALINITGRIAPGLNQALGDAERRVQRGLGNILNVGQAVGAGMTAAGGAILGALGYAAKGAADFDTALRKVNTVAKLSEEDLKKLGEKTIALSNEMGVGSVDALNAMYQALSAGVPADNVIDFLRVSAKASIGGIADLEQVVDGVTSAVNAYKASGLEAGKASDIMFKSAELGKTTFGELAASMSNVAPVAANAGISFEEINAAIAQLTLSGTKTAEATTQIRAAMLALINPNETMKLALSKLGYASGEAMLKQLGLIGSMQKLGTVQGMETTKTVGLKDKIVELNKQYLASQQKLDALTKQMPRTAKEAQTLANKKGELVKKMTELKGKIGETKEDYKTWAVAGNEGIVKALGSVEALGMYLGATGQNAKAMNDIMTQMKGAAGSADKAYQEMNKAANQQFKNLSANLENLRITIGMKIMPVINSFLQQTVIPMVKHVGDWIAKNPQLTETLVKVGAAVGGVMLVVGPLLMMLPGLISAFNGISVVLGAAGMTGGLTASVGGLTVTFTALGALLVGSLAVGGIIAGVAALGETFYKLATRASDCTNFISRFFDKLLSCIPGLKQAKDYMYDMALAFYKLPGKFWDWLMGNGTGIHGEKVDLGARAQAAMDAGKLPKMAAGGISRGGMTLVGERGPELVNLPAGSRVYSNAETRGMLGANVTVNINTTGKVTPAEARQIGKMIFAELALRRA